MKIQLTKTLPQPELGRVIPAGVIIDAPPGLAERLLRDGRAQPVQTDETPESAVATAESAPPEAAPAEEHNETPKRGKKVTAHA